MKPLAPIATRHTAPDVWLDDGELSAAEKRLIEERITDFEMHPETSIPWAVVEEELKRRYGP